MGLTPWSMHPCHMTQQPDHGAGHALTPFWPLALVPRVDSKRKEPNFIPMWYYVIDQERMTLCWYCVVKFWNYPLFVRIYTWWSKKFFSFQPLFPSFSLTLFCFFLVLLCQYFGGPLGFYCWSCFQTRKHFG